MSRPAARRDAESASRPLTRARKRARQDDSDPPLPTFLPHPDLWFEDGSVVLVAPGSASANAGRGFRVHKSILSRKSEVMKHLFSRVKSLGENEGNEGGPVSDDISHECHVEEEVFEGCPVIRLADDAELLAAFLEILYDRPT